MTALVVLACIVGYIAIGLRVAAPIARRVWLKEVARYTYVEPDKFEAVFVLVVITLFWLPVVVGSFVFANTTRRVFGRGPDNHETIDKPGSQRQDTR